MTLVVPLLLALPLLVRPSRAKERVMRVYDEKDGLAISEIAELAQDSRGFIWIGTMGGVYRFDGREMRKWAPDTLRHVVEVLSTGPDGEVLIGCRPEPLYQVRGEGTERIAGPDGRSIEDWVHASMARDGALWITRPDTLLRRGRDGAWSRYGIDRFDSGRFFRVRPGPGGSVFVATDRSLWSIRDRGAPEKLADVGIVNEVETMSDSSLVFLTRDGKLFHLHGRNLDLLAAGDAHGRGLAVRRDRIWASIDQYIIEMRPGEKPDTIAPTPEFPTGRPMLVDREEDLWIGGYRGILCLPEPETVTFNDLDGLPSPTHCRYITRAQEKVWISTWYGSGILEEKNGSLRGRKGISAHSGRFCPDGLGGVWITIGDSSLVCMKETGRELRYPFPGLHGIYGYAMRGDGTLWLATDDGIILTGPGTPRRITSPPPWSGGWDNSYLSSISEDRGGRLWFGRMSEICSAPADSLERGDPVHWRRDEIPNADEVTSIQQMPSGDIWASTSNGGVLRCRDGAWNEIPASHSLASVRAYRLVPSPSGGIWILAAGSIIRVRELRADASGWEVLERLTAWQGLPVEQASDLFEEPDGRIWLASLAGVVMVPPEARRAVKKPPPIELVEVTADGRRLPIERIPDLPFRRNRLELRFAALSFRDRNLIRYHVRMRPNAPWFESSDPFFRFVDLAPGRYMAEIRASLDGESWSPSPARIDFRVERPWFLQVWALSLFALVALASGVAVHRIRVAFLLRLERQRTRIAMDLHDEIGSGLGGIGILAGLAATDEIDDESRRGLASRIAEAAGEMGNALTDIVWSLRNGSESLESLAIGLAERGGRLFPTSDVRFETRFPPSWPGGRLPLTLRRGLQLIALEAMHNASRHSGAERVVLGFEPAGRSWRMWIADDGKGIPDESRDMRGGGHGLRNMRSRAREIAAEITIERRGDAGRLDGRSVDRSQGAGQGGIATRTDAGADAATNAATGAGTDAATNAATDAGTDARTDEGPDGWTVIAVVFDPRGSRRTAIEAIHRRLRPDSPHHHAAPPSGRNGGPSSGKGEPMR